MTVEQTTIHLKSTDETTALATRLGAYLRPGDTLLLSGGIGVGKTHFARSLIQSLLIEPEDVPSPTFTLVQVYETQTGELWHSDLYRLSSPDDCVELGLTDAFETAICVIEWPDRLQDLMPKGALSLTFEDGDDDNARHLTLAWSNPRWALVVSESLA